ncbi:helix-turn-helix domain-containing protein [Candidatus Micrarchaeota archaeon]|nr:helix-turn-helix domain-containing protein [Candidatus Micrarchaeota archaeon]
MWVAELKVWHEGSETCEVSEKFDVTIETHYLNVFTQHGKDYVTKVMVVRGEKAEAAKRAIIEEVRRRGIVSIADEGDQLFFIVPACEQFHTSVLGSNTFFVRAQLIKDGHLFWIVASWEKKHLMDLYKKIRKLPKTKATIELLSLKQETVPIFASSLLSTLTAKQRSAFESACHGGYYACPRKISLEDLAKKTGVAYTTFKDRLRSAEEKLWPAFVK